MSGNQRAFHLLKSQQENFLSIDSGVQIRKNDRNFKEDDVIYFVEVDSELKPTGNSQAAVITHVYHGSEGILPDYVVLKVVLIDILIHEGEKYVSKSKPRRQ